MRNVLCAEAVNTNQRDRAENNSSQVYVHLKCHHSSIQVSYTEKGSAFFTVEVRRPHHRAHLLPVTFLSFKVTLRGRWACWLIDQSINRSRRIMAPRGHRTHRHVHSRSATWKTQSVAVLQHKVMNYRHRGSEPITTQQNSKGPWEEIGNKTQVLSFWKNSICGTHILFCKGSMALCSQMSLGCVPYRGRIGERETKREKEREREGMRMWWDR